MNKTTLTHWLEYLTYDYFYLKRGLLCGMEVQVPFKKRADFVGINKKNEITVCEIKTSVQDFKSINGHNFVGDWNYYIIPKDMWDNIKEDIPQHVGVMVPHGKTLRVIKKAQNVKHKYPKTFIESIRYNIETAKQSNVRRLLYQRYKTNIKK